MLCYDRHHEHWYLNRIVYKATGRDVVVHDMLLAEFAKRAVNSCPSRRREFVLLSELDPLKNVEL